MLIINGTLPFGEVLFYVAWYRDILEADPAYVCIKWKDFCGRGFIYNKRRSKIET